jgi:hypothetical protein
MLDGSDAKKNQMARGKVGQRLPVIMNGSFQNPNPAVPLNSSTVWEKRARTVIFNGGRQGKRRRGNP